MIDSRNEPGGGEVAKGIGRAGAGGVRVGRENGDVVGEIRVRAGRAFNCIEEVRRES